MSVSLAVSMTQAITGRAVEYNDLCIRPRTTADATYKNQIICGATCSLDECLAKVKDADAVHQVRLAGLKLDGILYGVELLVNIRI